MNIDHFLDTVSLINLLFGAVLYEKPFAVNRGEAKEMAAACSEEEFAALAAFLDVALSSKELAWLDLRADAR